MEFRTYSGGKCTFRCISKSNWRRRGPKLLFNAGNALYAATETGLINSNRAEFKKPNNHLLGISKRAQYTNTKVNSDSDSILTLVKKFKNSENISRNAHHFESLLLRPQCWYNCDAVDAQDANWTNFMRTLGASYRSSSSELRRKETKNRRKNLDFCFPDVVKSLLSWNCIRRVQNEDTYFFSGYLVTSLFF